MHKLHPYQLYCWYNFSCRSGTHTPYTGDKTSVSHVTSIHSVLVIQLQLYKWHPCSLHWWYNFSFTSVTLLTVLSFTTQLYDTMALGIPAGASKEATHMNFVVLFVVTLKPLMSGFSLNLFIDRNSTFSITFQNKKSGANGLWQEVPRNINLLKLIILVNTVKLLIFTTLNFH